MGQRTKIYCVPLCNQHPPLLCLLHSAALISLRPAQSSIANHILSHCISVNQQVLSHSTHSLSVQVHRSPEEDCTTEPHRPRSTTYLPSYRIRKSWSPRSIFGSLPLFQVLSIYLVNIYRTWWNGTKKTLWNRNDGFRRNPSLPPPTEHRTEGSRPSDAPLKTGSSVFRPYLRRSTRSTQPPRLIAWGSLQHLCDRHKHQPRGRRPTDAGCWLVSLYGERAEPSVGVVIVVECEAKQTNRFRKATSPEGECTRPCGAGCR